MRIFYLILFVFFSLFSISNAEQIKDKQSAKDLAHKAMQAVASGNIERSFDILRPYTNIPDHEYEGMKNAYRMQAPAIKQRFGETVGVEFIKTEEVGESLMLVVYIQKYENHLMRWRFYFYKAKDTWIINKFSTDDNVQLIFESK